MIKETAQNSQKWRYMTSGKTKFVFCKLLDEHTSVYISKIFFYLKPIISGFMVMPKSHTEINYFYNLDLRLQLLVVIFY